MNLLEILQIKTEKVTGNEVILVMPVLEHHKQPFGIVHGGIYGTLIETAVSLGGMENVIDGEVVLGIDLQVNHLKAVSEGALKTVAHPNHIGRTTQVWEATVYNEKDQKIAVGRCTLLNKKHP